MDGELRQRRAAQILISGAVFELVSLSQPVARGTRWWVEKATQQRDKELAGLSESVHIPLVVDATASITAEVLGERERVEHHLCIDVLLSSAL